MRDEVKPEGSCPEESSRYLSNIELSEHLKKIFKDIRNVGHKRAEPQHLDFTDNG